MTFRGWYPVRVAGDSMAPTLRPGDLLAVRALRATEPRPGQIVVARAAGREVVKRIALEPGPGGSFRLEGDNRGATTDADVPRDHIVGIVRARYWPVTRARVF